MPGFDGTGPAGNGSGGWGRGICNNNAASRGRFFNGGRGRGICRFFSGQVSNNISLDEEEKILTQRLDVIRKAKESETKE